MSKFTQKSVKFSQLFALGAVVATTTMVGCTKNDDKKTDKKAEPAKTETKATALDCASPSAVSSIQKALTTQIAQQATNTVKQLGQQAGLDVANVTMDGTLSQLMVNVQNSKAVAGQADQCQTSVSITLPESDIANANQLAASLNQPTLVQRLNGKGLTLENNTVIAQNVGFKLTQAGDNYTATSVSADSIINEVSNVLANSQLKQMMVQSKVISPTAAATGAMAGAATTTVVTRKYTQTPQKPTPKAVTPVKPKTVTVQPKNTEATSTKTPTDHTTKTVTKTTTATTATPAVNTKTTSIEKTVTTKAVPNDNTKLTIEEKNEKY